MFTLTQIQTAHQKVETGADFPRYIQDLIALGVCRFETFVVDSHTNYYGKDAYKISSPAMYEALHINAVCDAKQFKEDLKAHQMGQTDYLGFCKDCANSGIEKWVVDLKAMTCIYYDLAANEILVEAIPGV